MVLSDQKISFENLLSQQLQGFSQLTESLTLRLLELEERLDKLENPPEVDQAFEGRSTHELLVESEKVVRHLKGLLNKDYSPTELFNSESVSLIGEQSEQSLDPEQIATAPLQDSFMDDIEKPEIASPEIVSVEEDDSVEFSDDLINSEYCDDQDMPLLSA